MVAGVTPALCEEMLRCHLGVWRRARVLSGSESRQKCFQEKYQVIENINEKSYGCGVFFCWLVWFFVLFILEVVHQRTTENFLSQKSCFPGTLPPGDEAGLVPSLPSEARRRPMGRRACPPPAGPEGSLAPEPCSHSSGETPPAPFCAAGFSFLQLGLKDCFISGPSWRCW